VRTSGNSKGGRHDDDGEHGASVDGKEDVNALQKGGREGGREASS